MQQSLSKMAIGVSFNGNLLGACRLSKLFDTFDMTFADDLPSKMDSIRSECAW